MKSNLKPGKQYVVYVWETKDCLGPLHLVYEGKNKDEALKNAKVDWKKRKPYKIKVIGRY